jgi:N-acetylglucosaminyldiphosphoundecaprenol N-acetyl-beta-D-mannosaminyltransferase
LTQYACSASAGRREFQHLRSDARPAATRAFYDSYTPGVPKTGASLEKAIKGVVRPSVRGPSRSEPPRIASPSGEAGARADVLGCRLDRVVMSEAVARCEDLLHAGRPARHVSINAAKIVAMENDGRLRRIVHESDLITADGQSVVWASRLVGDPLPARVAGIDLMLELLHLASRKGYRVFILGARQAVLERALEVLRGRYPGLTVAGWRNGYFTPDETPEIVAEITAARPDMLFVAMSSPRKEYFLGGHGAATGVPLMMGVGGAVDVIAGETRRAPVIVQRAGFEWGFRLLQEPRRLFGRYLATNSRFMVKVAAEALRRRVPFRRPWKR